MPQKTFPSLSRSDLRIVNVVSSTKAKCRIDIESLSTKLPFTQYEPGIFPGLIYRRRKPKATITLFSTGKIVSTGARSVKDSKRSIFATVSEIALIEGVSFDIEKIRTENIVAVADVHSEIDLEKVARCESI